MNKIIKLKSAFIAGVLTLSFVGFSQDKIVTYSEVPIQIQNYVKEHFPKNNVLQSKIDNEGLSKEFDLILSDNIELEFDRNNNIKSIDSKSNTKLPKSVIPKKIWEYVEYNYPQNYIVEWDLDRKHQSVKLENGIELEFTLKGVFLRIDN